MIMGKVYAFVANGSEEVELLAVVDVLLRGGQDVKLVSITGSKDVVSAHQISCRRILNFPRQIFLTRMFCFYRAVCRERGIWRLMRACAGNC